MFLHQTANTSLVRKQFSSRCVTSFECYIFVITKPDGFEEFWFKGRDVAEYLGYKRPNKAVLDHVSAEWKREWERINKGNVSLPL
jgi:prophage antirepressor-like protein